LNAEGNATHFAKRTHFERVRGVVGPGATLADLLAQGWDVAGFLALDSEVRGDFGGAGNQGKSNLIKPNQGLEKI